MLEDLQDEREEDIGYDCPFAPALCNKSRDLYEKSRKPKIYERYESEYKDKKRRLEKQRKEKERREIEKLENMQYHRPENRKFTTMKKSRSK